MEPFRQDSKAAARQAQFGLWDTICIIVGIVVGTGIFKTPGTIFALAGGPGAALAIWVAGGLLAIVGAFCFAELASTYPRSGGEYIYLTRAFGPWAGFLFAWGQLLIIRTGASMVVMAYVFADYAVRLARIDPETHQQTYPYIFTALALLPIVVLTITNVIGVRAGKWTQNLLTTVKVLGLGGVLAAGFLWARQPLPAEQYIAYEGRVVDGTADMLLLGTTESPRGRPFPLAAEAKITIDDREKKDADWLLPSDLVGVRARVLVRTEDPLKAVRVRATEHSHFGALSLALIFVLWTYAGWHEASYIVAEVRNQRRNLPLALILGTTAVIVLYLLVNVACLVGLGYDGASDSQVVAADMLKPWSLGEQAMCVLILISALGAINGIIFTSSRIFSEFGADHSLFARLGRWHSVLGTPVTALLAQAAISIATVLAVACFFKSRESFDVVVKGTAPVFWLFFLLTGLALFALRRLDRNIDRPFAVPLYPLTPLIYCAFCGLMLYSSVEAMIEEEMGWLVVALTGVAVLAGVPLYWLSRHTPRAANVATSCQLVD